jgi:hypothetical protein
LNIALTIQEKLKDLRVERGLTKQKNHPSTTLDELHLIDSMIELLKSGKINNRMLCEMATHEDFKRLMRIWRFMWIALPEIFGMNIKRILTVLLKPM